ncbi:hypothetical protein [Cellulosimicrobium sp. CUA-896]|uniref:hypothetical protein n=1 Tax=Cellulosimicrobium sp. CUA-896 TaxID=1517881 RepID=UPI00095B854B|nr:hypothetical protein [Cellulosimicrobium sp. CUA-896]OLT50921.1 hypothetical protein BJF88_02050 [Cellulosimicrobium sp. CUA-896]
MSEASRRMLAAVGVRTATGRDAVLAGVVAVVSVALLLVVERVVASEPGTAFGAGPGVVVVTTAERVVVLAVLVAQSACLVLRRRSPLACLALTVAGQVVLLAVLPAYVSFQRPRRPSRPTPRGPTPRGAGVCSRPRVPRPCRRCSCSRSAGPRRSAGPTRRTPGRCSACCSTRS